MEKVIFTNANNTLKEGNFSNSKNRDVRIDINSNIRVESTLSSFLIPFIHIGGFIMKGLGKVFYVVSLVGNVFMKEVLLLWQTQKK